MTEVFENSPDEATVRLGDDAQISLRRWSETRPERIVVSHGNGLAADAFRAFGDALSADFEVIAFDMRNHGRSGVGAVLDDPWPRYIRDIPEIFDAIQKEFGTKPTHGAFHSLSSASALLAQGKAPRDWKSLTLYEPPLPPAPDAALLSQFLELHDELARRTRTRRRSFSDPDQLITSFARSPTFEGIPSATLRQLAQAVMTRGEADEAWSLVCPPETEANTYSTHRICEFWGDLATVRTPTLVVVGSMPRPDMSILVRSGTCLAETFGFGLASVEGGSHLMQLQKPKSSAEHAAAFARAHAHGESAGPARPETQQQRG